MKIKYINKLEKNKLFKFIGFFNNSNRIEKNGSGSINLFGKIFEYHLGIAFYRTYCEIFEKKSTILTRHQILH